MTKLFANIHLQSGYHKRLSDSIIQRYILTNPKPNKVDDTVRKNLGFHYRKYEKFLVILSVKLLLPPNQTKNIRRQYPCHRNQGCIYTTIIAKIKIITEELYSKILELRITFVSRFENITFDHYITKPKSMLEWKLVVLFDKNPQTFHPFDYTHTRCNHPFFSKNFMIFT